jgi:hypothetical protein
MSENDQAEIVQESSIEQPASSVGLATISDPRNYETHTATNGEASDDSVADVSQTKPAQAEGESEPAHAEGESEPAPAPAVSQAAAHADEPWWISTAEILARRKGGLFWLIFSVVALLGLTVSAAAYYFLVRGVWHWGFSSTSSWWQGLLALVADFFLIILAIYPLVPAALLLRAKSSILVEESEKSRNVDLDKIGADQKKLEVQLIQPGYENIVNVLGLSRLELDKWDRTTRSQNRGSFAYAVIAMWIGFAIIGLGILSAFGFFQLGSSKDSLTINVVMLASGRHS